MSVLEHLLHNDKTETAPVTDGTQHLKVDDKQSLQHAQDKNNLTSQDTAKLVAISVLPGLELFESHAPAKSGEHWYSGAANVAKDLAAGSMDELKHHPGKLIESAAIGAGTAVLLAAAAPEIAVVAAVAGAGYGAYELYKHGGTWLQNADVVAHQDKHSAEEVNKAHAGMKDLGAGATDMAAGIVGGLAAGAATAGIRAAASSALESGSSDGIAAAESSATRSAGIVLENNSANSAGSVAENAGARIASSSSESGAVNAPLSETAAMKVPVSDSAAMNAPVSDSAAVAQPIEAPKPGMPATDAAQPIEAPKPGMPANDAAQPAEPTLEAAKPAPEAVKPAPEGIKPAPEADPKVDLKAIAEKEARVADSVRTNQDLFQGANQDDAVMTTKKQLYDVKFEQVTEEGGRMVKTLENRGTGEVVKPGQWIATRLDANGQPVIEDGMVNQWPIKAENIAKTYQVTADQLSNTNELVAPTRIDGPQVKMIQLQEPLHIETNWGPMDGKAGDYLAAYDYNGATGDAGSNFAIITKTSFAHTYELAE